MIIDFITCIDGFNLRIMGHYSMLCIMITWILIYLAVPTVVRGQQEFTPLQRLPPGCDRTGGSMCYTMYMRTGDRGSTWQEAFNYCRSIGHQLLIVENSQTQEYLKGFRSDQNTGNGHTWIAARRDPEANAYKNVGNGGYLDVNAVGNDYCVVLSPNGRLLSIPCYYNPRRALCQSRKQASGCMGYYIGGICLELSKDFYYNWFDARDYCRSRWEPDSDLAYTFITSPDVIPSLGMTENVWVGVMKAPWTWRYADGRVTYVHYSAWRDYEGAGRQEGCAHLELNDRAMWSDKGCQQHSKTFICQTAQSQPPTPTTSTSTTTTTTTTTSPTTSTTTTTPTTSPSDTDSSIDKTPFSYANVFDGTYWPRGYYAYFMNHSDLIDQPQGDVMKEDLTTGTKTLIMPHSVLRELNAYTYFISPDYRYVLIGYDRERRYRYSYTARYKIYNVETGVLLDFPTNNIGAVLQLAQWSTSGHQLSFVFENNLYLQSSPQSMVVQVTSDGYNAAPDMYIINGIPDWMFEEDVIWSRYAHYWSPDGRYIVFAKFDMTEVPLIKIIVFGEEDNLYPSIMEFPYPKAGDIRNGLAGPTTKVKLYVYDTQNPASQPKLIDPPVEFSRIDHYYTQVAWRDDVTVYIDWSNRALNKTITCLCDVRSSRSCVKNHELEEPRGWIYIPAVTPWFIDNANYYLTILPRDVTGVGRMRHLAKVKIMNSASPFTNTDASVVSFLTDGNHEVTEIVGYDKNLEVAYFISTNGDPTQRHLFSVGTRPSASGASCMTCGVNSDCLYMGASFSTSGRYYVHKCWGPGIPTYNLRSTNDATSLTGTDGQIIDCPPTDGRPGICVEECNMKAQDCITTGYKCCSNGCGHVCTDLRCPKGSPLREGSEELFCGIGPRSIQCPGGYFCSGHAVCCECTDSNCADNPCLGKICGADEICRAKAVQCIRAPCPLIAECKSTYRPLEKNEAVRTALGTKLLPRKQIININLADGFVGKAEILYPPNYDPTKTYRLLHFVYGGPDSQQVLQDHMLRSYLTNWLLFLSSSHNIIITSIDGRGAYGFGDDMRHSVYKKVVSTSVEDQIDGIRYLKNLLPISKTENAAVIGWSFGGKMSSLSLIHESNMFQCAAAIAPDTKLELYNTAYMERYFGLVNESYDAYQEGDVIRRASEFKGKKLLVAHGTKDDNVHFGHSAQFMRALMDAGVHFKQLVYMDENHNLAQFRTVSHLYEELTSFLLNDCWSEQP